MAASACVPPRLLGWRSAGAIHRADPDRGGRPGVPAGLRAGARRRDGRFDTWRANPAHRRLVSMHRPTVTWDPEDFGVGSAILLGDLCLSWSDEMLMASGLRDDQLQAAKPIFDEMRTELMAGQYFDLLEQVRGQFDLDSALTVARYKSAKYTVERPAHRAAAAGADTAHLDQLTDFGIPLGEAFQLRDDLLGVFGDPQETGKPAGDDLGRQGPHWSRSHGRTPTRYSRTFCAAAWVTRRSRRTWSTNCALSLPTPEPGPASRP